MSSTSSVCKRLCVRLFNRKSIINYIIISLSSVAILFGLMNYTPSVELIHKFKIGAKEDSSKEALKDRYLDIEEQILRFKTVKQHEEEEARKVKIAARWTVAGSNEYPFKLSSDGNFIMPIDMNGSHGYLTGKWELDNTTVTIHIQKNTVDENYKPYDWIFNYDEDADTLVGTGQFAGWEYTKY